MLLGKGDYPKMYMLCFVKINSILFNLLCIYLVNWLVCVWGGGEACVRACMCACVREKERDRERQTDTERQDKKERERERSLKFY